MGTGDRAGKSPLAASAAGDYQIPMAIARERVAPAMPTADAAAIEWRTSAGLMPYADAVAAMEARVAPIRGRVRQWVSYHGIALNVAPDLAHYRGIVPCGVSGHGVTSLAALGVSATMAEVDAALRGTFAEAFEADPQ